MLSVALQSHREHVGLVIPEYQTLGMWRSRTEHWNDNGAGNDQLCGSRGASLFGGVVRQVICFTSGKIAVVVFLRQSIATSVYPCDDKPRNTIEREGESTP